MQVTSYGHATVALEEAGHRLVLDPGVFGDAAAALAGASTVLLTHEHPDHVDAVAIRARLAEGDVQVWGPAGAVALLGDGLPDDVASRLHAVSPGEEIAAGPFVVRTGGTSHAVIHADIPRVPNVTYLVTGSVTAYHPGDSFDLPAVGGPVDVLFVPVSGPWLKIAEVIDFASGVDPRYVVPIHEALLSEIGLAMVDQRLGTARTRGTYEYRRLAPGEALAVAPHGGPSA